MMTARLADICALAAVLTITACASPVRTTELNQVDQFSGYRYGTLEQKAPKAVDKAAVVLTFSGGGTRAAAFADGVLQALAETEVKAHDGTLPLASQVDLVSSVSGGSVTAAYFALGGIAGLADLEQNFLYSDIMTRLITRTLFNPLQLIYPRIDIFESYLDDNVFHNKTYKDLIDADLPGKTRRPYIVLNAADMASGSVFSFNQDQFDLICADLADLKIADAVSASAAFPVALSPLTLKNRAPCDAQHNAPLVDISGWQTEDGWPEPKRIVVDRAAKAIDGMNYPEAENLARFRRGTVALTYLNRDNKKDFIQLLDGGIADNLALTLPLTLLTSQSESPSFLSWVNSRKADKLLLIVVNARGQADNDLGKRARPPGTIDTLITAIGTPIDATSFQLLAKLDLLVDNRFKPKSIVLIDFDLITNPDCRAHFHNMATSWTLGRPDVDDLIALGTAMVLQSPSYQAFVAALGGTVPPPQRSVEQICRQLPKPL
jgi:NTE family protein